MNSNWADRNNQKNLFFNVVIFILIFFMAIRIPLDSDFWWHLRSGQLSVMNGYPILEDQTSFTVFQSPWINHSWLSQILFYSIFTFLGFQGIMLLVALIATFSMVFVYLRLKSNPIINGFTILLCVMTTAVIWSPRPQLITLLFFSILTYIVFERNIFKKRYLYFLLPVLFWIWGNFHAGFSTGIIFLITFFTGLMLDFFLEKDKKFQPGKLKLSLLALSIFISSMAVMINPNGIDIWKVQFNTVTLPSLQSLIPEWASPNFHELYQQPFLWLWLLLVFLFLSNGSKYSFSVILPLLVFGGLGFISRRNYVYFSILAIPILNYEILQFYNKYIKDRISSIRFFEKLKSLNREPRNNFSKYINLLFVALLLLVTASKIVYFGEPIVFQAYENQNYPKEAVVFLEQLKPEKLKCLNSYAWGGYLSWKIPELKIFIDGRTDLYGEKIIQDWIEMVNGGEKWKEKFDTYEINCVVLENNRPVIHLLELEGWKNGFENEFSIVLYKPTN